MELEAIAKAALERLKSSLEQRGARPGYINRVGEKNEQELAVPLLEVRSFVGHVFGIILEESGDGKALEAKVSANFRINLGPGQTATEPRAGEYENGLRTFYREHAEETLRGFTREGAHPFRYQGIYFPECFLLLGVSCRKVSSKEKEAAGKFRYVFEARFSVRRGQKNLTEGTLIEGLYLYCLRGFIAHHAGYVKSHK